MTTSTSLEVRPTAGEPPRQHGAAAARLPREHGYWVMLTVALTSGAAVGASTRAVAAAGIAGLVATAAAMLVGRRVRRSAALQVSGELGLGVLAALIALAGGAHPSAAALLGAVLVTAFLVGGLSVRALLERGRRRPRRATALGVTAAAVAWVGCAAVTAYDAPSAAALAVSALAATLLLVWSPSPKRLRAVGLLWTAAHALSAALATLG